MAGNFKVEDRSSGDRDEVSSAKLFLQGFWVAAGNPKAIVFFSALFPQFITSGQASLQHFSVMLGLLCIIAFACMMIYACGGKKVREFLKGSIVSRYVNKVLGTAFVGLGISLACTRR